MHNSVCDEKTQNVGQSVLRSLLVSTHYRATDATEIGPSYHPWIHPLGWRSPEVNFTRATQV